MTSIYLIFAIILLLFLNGTKLKGVNIRHLYLGLFLFILIAVHSTWRFVVLSDWSSLFNVIFLVPVLFLSVYLIASWLLSERIEVLKLALLFFAILVLSIGTINVLWPTLNYYVGYEIYNNPFFPFTEPSHYAVVAIFSVMSISGFLSHRVSSLLNFCLLGLGLMIPNLTLIVGFLLNMLIRLSRRSIYTVGILLLFIWISKEQIFGDYFLSRLTISSSSSNLSVLAYLQGWADLQKALIETHGLGLGYRMMGSNEPSFIANRISELGFDQISRKDGSFLLSKVLVEFGIFGLIFIVHFSIQFYKSVLLSKRSILITNFRYYMLKYMTFSLIIELLFRGTDYFSGTVVFSLGSLVALLIFVKSVERKKN